MAICKPGCSCGARRIQCETPLTLMELELVLCAWASKGCCLVLSDADDQQVAASLAARVNPLLIVGEQIPESLRRARAADGLAVLITDEGDKLAFAHSLLLTRVLERSRLTVMQSLLSTLPAPDVAVRGAS